MKMITVTDYLKSKNILFIEKNGELLINCVFNQCDADRRNNELPHLYINPETSQYHCKKCNEKGNIYSLIKQLGDNLANYIEKPRSHAKFNQELVEKCHQALPSRIREYLLKRGISDFIIEKFKLGWGCFYGKYWITIPIYDENGQYTFFKLRKDPFSNDKGEKYLVFPSNTEHRIYGLEYLKEGSEVDELVITEGEFDRLVLESNGISAISSTGGCGTFKSSWKERIVKSSIQKIYICYDSDEPGQRNQLSLLTSFRDLSSTKNYYSIKLPQINDCKDITDYFSKHNGNVDEFIYSLPKEFGILNNTASKDFSEMSYEDLTHVLGLTIKKDEVNKVTTFLAMLAAYTEEDQLNVSYNAPSSTGKSYIPIELKKLFPKEDVVEIDYATPTSFFYKGEVDEETKERIVDLSRKILIFVDQPHNELLARLRPLLSHDEKVFNASVTNKQRNAGNRTEEVKIIGYPSVVFCSAGLNIDEQESTRMLLLSPELTQEKIREAVYEKVKKATNRKKYKDTIEADSDRQILIKRIYAIRDAHIDDIIIENNDKILKLYLNGSSSLKARDARDIGKFISLIKGFAILNFMHRKIEGNTVYANENDIQLAWKLWQTISESENYGLSPYLLDFFKNIIIPTYNKKNENITEYVGISREEILRAHLSLTKQHISEARLRQQILPMLERVGLIISEKNGNKLLYSLTSFEQTSELKGGYVDEEADINELFNSS